MRVLVVVESPAACAKEFILIFDKTKMSESDICVLVVLAGLDLLWCLRISSRTRLLMLARSQVRLLLKGLLELHMSRLESVLIFLLNIINGVQPLLCWIRCELRFLPLVLLFLQLFLFLLGLLKHFNSAIDP